MLEKSIKQLNRVSIRVRVSISFRVSIRLSATAGAAGAVFSHTRFTEFLAVFLSQVPTPNLGSVGKSTVLER